MIGVTGSLLIGLWGLLLYTDLRRIEHITELEREPSPTKKFRVGLVLGGAIVIAPLIWWLAAIMAVLTLVDSAGLIGQRQRNEYYHKAVVSYLTNPRGRRGYAFEMMKNIGVSSGTLYAILIKLEQDGVIAHKQDEVPNAFGFKRTYYFAVDPEDMPVINTDK